MFGGGGGGVGGIKGEFAEKSVHAETLFQIKYP